MPFVESSDQSDEAKRAIESVNRDALEITNFARSRGLTIVGFVGKRIDPTNREKGMVYSRAHFVDVADVELMDLLFRLAETDTDATYLQLLNSSPYYNKGD